MAGGTANNLLWLKIRANVLNQVILRPAYSEGAFGAAVLAASKTYYTNLMEAAQAMIRIKDTVEPELELAAQYDETYLQFVDVLKERQYI